MGEDKFPDLERRRFPRIKDNFFIFGNLRSASIEDFKAFTKDISAGGLMFETEREIPEASKLELEIYQPLARDKRIIFSIPVMAKIIWTRKIEKDNFEVGENKYRIGIEFSEIREEDRQKITQYVEESTLER